MEEKTIQQCKRKAMPEKIENYSVKFVFKKDSLLDVNDIIKNSFLIRLNEIKI